MTDYIDKTQYVVNFLTRIFSENLGMMASIQVAQAKEDTDWLIDLLGAVKDNCENWIKELKEI